MYDVKGHFVILTVAAVVICVMSYFTAFPHRAAPADQETAAIVIVPPAQPSRDSTRSEPPRSTSPKRSRPSGHGIAHARNPVGAQARWLLRRGNRWKVAPAVTRGDEDLHGSSQRPTAC